MQALQRLGEYSRNVPNTDQPDYIRRWQKAKQKILAADSLWEQLVKMSASGAQDYEYLQNRDPLFITNYFIAKMIQQ